MDNDTRRTVKRIGVEVDLELYAKMTSYRESHRVPRLAPRDAGETKILSVQRLVIDAIDAFLDASEPQEGPESP